MQDPTRFDVFLQQLHSNSVRNRIKETLIEANIENVEELKDIVINRTVDNATNFLQTAFVRPLSKTDASALAGLLVSFDNQNSQIVSILQDIQKTNSTMIKLAVGYQKYYGSPITGSPAENGRRILNNLNKYNAIHEIKAIENQPTAISQTSLLQAQDLYVQKINQNKSIHERLLVNLFTPEIQSIVEEIDPNITLINSEEYQWLRGASEDQNYDLKPDLLVAYHALIENKPPYKNAPPNQTSRKFGRFSCWNCRASIWCLFGAKWKLDNAALGETAKYLQLCGQRCSDWKGEELKLKLILFEVEEFWMVESLGAEITNLTKCKWNCPGSRDVFKNFITTTDHWMIATEALLSNLNKQFPSTIHSEPFLKSIDDQKPSSTYEVDSNVQPPQSPTLDQMRSQNRNKSTNFTENNDQDDQKPSSESSLETFFYLPSILGAGSNGRAYRLSTGEVLKVAVGDSASSLEKEFRTILNIQNNPTTQHFVIPVIPNSFRYFNRGFAYAGYLLQYEGSKVESTCPRLQGKETWSSTPGQNEISLVNFLYDLHQSGIIHGDPRLDNILMKDGHFKFIDFMQSSSSYISAKEKDFAFLFNSLTGVDFNIILSDMKNIFQPTLEENFSQMNIGNPDSILGKLVEYLNVLWSSDYRK